MFTSGASVSNGGATPTKDGEDTQRRVEQGRIQAGGTDDSELLYSNGMPNEYASAAHPLGSGGYDAHSRHLRISRLATGSECLEPRCPPNAAHLGKGGPHQPGCRFYPSLTVGIRRCHGSGAVRSAAYAVAVKADVPCGLAEGYSAYSG